MKTTLNSEVKVDVFVPRSPNIQFLQLLYKIHIVIGLPLALFLIIRPELLLDGDVTEQSSFAALRSYGCLLLSFCTILYKFCFYDRVKHHRGLAKALLVLHISGALVFSTIFIVEILENDSKVYTSPFLIGVILHLLFLIAILVRPGFKWIRKADGHQHVPFQHEHLLGAEGQQSDGYGAISMGPVQIVIQDYYQARDFDERKEAIQELWDKLDEDQSGVLGASQCLKLIKEFSLYEKQIIIKTMRLMKTSVSSLPPLCQNEAERLAWSSVRRVDKFLFDVDNNPDIYIEKLMSQMDVDGDGQVDKKEFYEMAEKVVFDVTRPLGGLNFSPSQGSGCPIQ